MESRVLICTGKYADEPFHLKSVCVNVYCVEELCYLFANNPFMINTEIMDRELIGWLTEQCELPELGEKLSAALRRGIQAGEFVDIILNYVNYCTEEETQLIEEVLKSNAGLNDFERKKKQADYLLKNQRPMLAVSEYENLLRILPETENALRPFVYHNIGTAYAELFMFEVAARYFKHAYELSHDQESGLQYLSALRICLSEEEYIRFIAEHSSYHELSLLLEKKLTAARGEFEASRENRMLSALKIYKEEGNVASYYEEIDKLIGQLKEDYLQFVSG